VAAGRFCETRWKVSRRGSRDGYGRGLGRRREVDAESRGERGVRGHGRG